MFREEQVKPGLDTSPSGLLLWTQRCGGRTVEGVYSTLKLSLLLSYLVSQLMLLIWWPVGVMDFVFVLLAV